MGVSTVLDSTDIANAKAAIDTYLNTCRTLATSVKTTVDALPDTPNFLGQAQIGYKTFHNALANNLDQSLDNLMTSIKGILDDVENILITTTDAQLGTANGSAAGTGVAK